MKIKTQISISLIIFALLAVVIIFSVYSSNNQLQDIQTKQQIIDNIETSSSELYYLENDYIVYGGTIPAKRWNAKYVELTGYFQVLKLTDPSQQAVLNQMFDGQNELNKSFSNLVALTSSGQGTGPGGVSQELKEFSASTLGGQTQMLMSRSSELSHLVKAEAHDVEQRTNLIISFSIAVLILFVLLNYLVINRSVLKSISALQNGAERIGKGDLDTKIEKTGDDELGYLSRTFNEMASSIKDSHSLLLASNEDLELEITGHKRAEDALRQSEEKYRTYIENSPVGIFILVSMGRYRDVNTSACSMLGYSREELLSLSVRDLVPANSLTKGLSNLKKLQEDGFLATESALLKKNGDTLPVTLNAVRLPDGKFLGFCSDLTERKRAEDALRQSEMYLSSILRSAPIGIGVTSHRIIRTVNDRICEMLGYTEEELTGKSTRFVYPTQEDYDDVGEANKAQIREKRSGSLETRWQKKDGTIIEVLLSSTPLDSADLSSGITFTALDITERKKGENIIRESEEKFRGIFDNINDGLHIHEIGPDGKPGKFIEVNEVACRMLQYTREEMLKHSPLDFVTDYHSKPLDQIFLENSTTGHSIFETGHRRKDGTVIPVEINTHVVNLQGKRVIVAVVRDITERKLTKDTLQRVNQKLNVLSQLTRNDLTNQIFVLSSYLELAKQQLAGQDRIIETVQKGVRVIQSIHETIQYSKDFQDMGAKPPKWQNLKMALLMGLSHLSIGKIQHSLETENLEIFADPLLEKVCQRLFENSVKHGDHVTHIRVWHTATPDGVTVFFEDDGIGISAEMKEQIFLRGEGTGRASMRSLIFVREILDITGITIKETGEPGKGVRFEMKVPKGSYRMNPYTRNGKED